MDPALFRDDLESKTKDAAAVQANLLSQMMELNGETEYLRRYGGRFDSLPIIEYHDVADDVQRIANGDTSPILTAEPVVRFFTSSGTVSGEPKLIPATSKSLELLFRRPVYMMESDVCLGFLFAKPENKSPGGLPVSTTTSMFFKVQGENLKKMFTSPMELLLAPDINQSLYCHLLCGLIRSEDVTQVFAALAITLVEALRLLEEAWSELADDVQTGTLNSKITDPTLRSSLSLCLRPNPKLAQSIRKECTADNAWCGIVERLWPKSKVIVTITTGGMAPYALAVRKYGGSVPIVSGDYVCTECVLGFNLDPFCPPESVSFTIHPEYAYYEFLPYPQKLTNRSTVKLVDVKVGEEYELVVSTWSGLYRYKVGDIVRVTGFHNSSPNISFVHRLNAVLDMAGERSTEAELQVAVQKSQHCLPASQELVDFTCHQDGQRYVIFWELKNGASLNPIILETCCCVLDTSLTERYKQRRENGLIGPLRLCIVRGKTFKALQQYSLEKGINPTQYKTPRCITSPEMIAILQAGITQDCQTPA